MEAAMTLDTAYVVDFDGTITTRDITSELALYYGGSAYMEIENSYRHREIPIRVWLQRIAKLLPADMEQLKTKALKWAVIRPGFKRFLEHAHSNGRPVIIASDGFGFYVELILERHGLLGQIDKIYRNDTSINRKKELEVRNPHAHKTCTVCGNCKAAQVVRLKEKGRSVIYIGDGSNDRFGASWSDHVCAREELAEACLVHNFTYSQWNDFYDIIKVNRPELSDRSEASLCCPMGSGVKT
jgi:2-hydroxy-3-keto-5-methylthiopentenyl-1-phosphate phosphatase